MPYPPDAEIFVDRSFYKHSLRDLQRLYEQGVKLYSKKYHRLTGLKAQITQYDSTRERPHYYGKQAIEKNMIYYGRMGLCGAFTLSLAVGSGYDEIFLLGYDFGSSGLDNKDTHVHQDKITQLDILCSGAGRPEVYRHTKSGRTMVEVEDFNVHLQVKDIKIWNVSMISNIPYFEKITYEEFFKKCSSNCQNG